MTQTLSPNSSDTPRVVRIAWTLAVLLALCGTLTAITAAAILVVRAMARDGSSTHFVPVREAQTATHVAPPGSVAFQTTLTASGAIVHRGSSPESIRLVSLNTDNYTLTDRMVEGTYRRAYPKPEAEKTALREVLIAVNADIIALQEIGGQAHLLELQRDLNAASQDYPFSHVVMAADEDRQLALLSRLPFEATDHTNLTIPHSEESRLPVKRGLLQADFDTEHGPFTIFVVHLKSRHSDDPDDPLSARRRAAEATVLRNRIRELFPEGSDRPYLILGDLNDHPRSAPVRRFLEVSGRTLTTALDTEDQEGSVWTHFFRREARYERIDYALANPAFLLRFRTDSHLVSGAGMEAASDHRALVVDIKSSTTVLEKATDLNQALPEN